jgi:hypothetical protein
VKPRLVVSRPWSEHTVEILRGCFDCTEWACLNDPTADINTNLDVITEYIKFCNDTVVPLRKKKVFPNNTKPWFTADIYNLLKQKRSAFSAGDMNKVAELNKEARAEIRRAKLRYKDKVEEKFRNMNTKEAFQHLKTMTEDSDPKAVAQPTPGDPAAFAADLNTFYNRFDKAD